MSFIIRLTLPEGGDELYVSFPDLALKPERGKAYQFSTKVEADEFAESLVELFREDGTVEVKAA